MWNWNVMDSETRYILASHLSKHRDAKAAQAVFRKALAASAEPPKTIKTDKLRSYVSAARKMFPDAQHIQSDGIRSQDNNNNRSERLQGTFRDRAKTLRGLETRETGQRYLDGWVMDYNLFRDHEALGGRTPGQAAKVDAPFREWSDVVRARSHPKGGATSIRRLRPRGLVVPTDISRAEEGAPSRKQSRTPSRKSLEYRSPPKKLAIKGVSQWHWKGRPRPAVGWAEREEVELRRADETILGVERDWRLAELMPKEKVLVRAFPRIDIPDWIQEWVTAPDTNGHQYWVKSRGRGQQPSIKVPTAGGQTRTVHIHRALWILRHGYISRNIYLTRTCSDYVCVNPDHFRPENSTSGTDYHRARTKKHAP